MKKKRIAQSAFSSLCMLLGLVVFLAGVLLAVFASANPQASIRERASDVIEHLPRPNDLPASPAGGVYAAWVATYNGPGNNIDEAHAIAVDSSGNVYMTGRSTGNGIGFDYATIKYDSAGQQQWVARYTGFQGYGDDEANAIAVDGSGNVYVTGRSMGLGSAEDYATIKYNSSGQQQWVARYNGPGNFSDTGYAITVDSSGNVYVTGQSDGGGQGSNYDYATIKYNSDGQQQWVARYNGPGNDGDAAYAISIDASSNVYVTGVSVGSGTDADYATIKYDSAGQEQWVARYNGSANGSDYANAIAVDNAANVYVTGWSRGAGSDFDYATIKYDSAGQEQWTARYHGPGNGLDQANAIAVDNSGNVYVTGTSNGSGTSADYGTIKYNSVGQEQWVARYNGPANNGDEAHAIALDTSGNVYVTGQSYGAGGDTDYATIKYDSAGQEQWVMRYNGPGNSFDFAFAVAVDSSENVYVAGESNVDYVTIKYVQGPTPTPTATATASPTPTPTFTPTPTATASPTVTPTPSDFGGSPTPSPIPTATPTPSDCPGGCTPSPTPTATPSEAPCAAFDSQPACNSTVFTQLTDFFVYISGFVGSLPPPSVFTVNGIPADTVSGGGSTLEFHFNASPVIPGQNTMDIPPGAFTCSNSGRPFEGFHCTFTYQPPRSTLTPRPRPTPAPRP
jgi:uncharacterized delta-60 repeat protein